MMTLRQLARRLNQVVREADASGMRTTVDQLVLVRVNRPTKRKPIYANVTYVISDPIEHPGLPGCFSINAVEKGA